MVFLGHLMSIQFWFVTECDSHCKAMGILTVMDGFRFGGRWIIAVALQMRWYNQAVVKAW